MCKVSVGSLVVSLLLVSAAGAQERLTLDAAIDEALGRNVTLASERASADIARHKPAQELALPAPMFEAQIWRWPITTLNPGKVDMYMVGAEQRLPARGWRSAAARLAEREADVAALNVDTLERDIVAEVSMAYADLAVARRARVPYGDALDAVQQLGDTSVVRYAAATSLGQQDVLKSVVEIARLHEELIDLTEAERRAETRLATLLGRHPGERIGEIAGIPDLSVKLSPAALQQIAEAKVPELRLAQAERAAAAASVDLARIARKPEFLVRAGYMLMPGEAGAWTATAGISWPQAPWSRKRFDALDAERKAAVSAAEARLTTVRQAIATDIQHALISLDSARARVELLRTTLIPQANQSLEVARIGYTTGQVSFLDVIDNHRVHLAAELEVIRAEGAVMRATAELERAIGERLISPVVQAALAAQEK
jgi:outer membrane protein, heavy metal efflux system